MTDGSADPAQYGPALIEQGECLEPLERNLDTIAIAAHQLEPVGPPPRWLEGKPVAAELEVLRVAGPPIEASWAPPATVATWGWPISLETIRFAAANRLCVELGCGGSRRIIEPYSLRRSRAGDLLLYAVRADSGEPRAYRVDRIESVRATQRSFTPRFRVELAAAGGLQAPPVATR